MPLRNREPERWVFDNTTSPPSFLPAGMDTSGLKDVTCVGDRFRKYLHLATGEVIDGADFYADSLEDLKEGTFAKYLQPAA